MISRGQRSFILAAVAGVAAAVTSMEVIRAASRVSALDEVAHRVRVVARLGSLAHEFQKEREATAGFIASRGAKFAAEMHRQRGGTDAVAGTLERDLSGLAEAEAEAEADKAVRHTLDGARGRHVLRSRIDSGQADAWQAFDWYTGAIETFLTAAEGAVPDDADGELRDQEATYQALLRAKEFAGRERASLDAVFASDAFDPDSYRRFLSSLTAQEFHLSRFQRRARPEVRAAWEEASSGARLREVAELRAVALERSDRRGFGADPSRWFEATAARIDAMTAVEQRLAGDLIALADSQRSRAWRRLAASLAALVVLAAAGLVVLRRRLHGRVELGGRRDEGELPVGTRPDREPGQGAAPRGGGARAAAPRSGAPGWLGGLRRWFEGSIAHRMAVVGSASAAVFLLMVGVTSYLLVREQVITAASSELEAESQLVGERIEAALQTAAQEIAGLSATSLVANGLVDSAGRSSYLEPFLREKTVPIGTSFRLALADHAGRVVSSRTGEGGDFGKRPWWSGVVGSNRPGFEVLVGAAPSFLMAFPVVYAETGRPEGALVLEVPLLPLLGVAGEPFREQGHRVELRLGREVLGLLLPPGHDPAESSLQAERPLGMLAPGVDSGLSVAVRTSRERALSGLDGLARAFLVGGLLFLLLSAVVAYLAAQWLVAPLQLLSEAAQKARTRGNGAVRFELEGSDERAELARSLQAMVDGLWAAREQLEARVAERTEALGFAESRLRAILDHMLDGLITIGEDGVIQSFNRGAERIFGWSSAEVVGRNVSCLMAGRDRDQHDAYLRRYRATGERRIIGSGRVVEGIRKDGTTFALELAVSDVRAGEQRIFVGLVRDVTDRVRMERQKSEFVSTVSHELRTPLTAIHGALGLLAGGAAGALPAPAERLVAMARDNGERLTRLIDDLLDMQRIEAGKLAIEPAPTPVALLLAKAIEHNQAYADRLRVVLELADDGPGGEVTVDPHRFQQVMANLLSNACKFSPAGGLVVLAAVATPGGRIRFEVRDRGPGIPEAFRERIFKSFAQADSSISRHGSGTGLGLAISKALVERMGGQIGYHSTPGEGATFHASFPATAHQPSLNVADGREERA